MKAPSEKSRATSSLWRSDVLITCGMIARIAVDSMSSTSQTELRAHAAWESGRLNEAFRLFRMGAVAGSAGCMIDLGYFYDVGVGTRKNFAKALHWYKRAYRKGDSAAASNIAILYRERLKNRLAVEWFRRSADLGDGDSLLELAKHYLSGKGVRHSAPQAIRHLRRALSSKSITPASIDEAKILLQIIGSTTKP